LKLDFVKKRVGNLNGYIEDLEDENTGLAEEVQKVFEEIERYKILFE